MDTTRKATVLLVDDNDATCALVTAILQREFAIDVATDGVEALEKLKTKSYEAILLDLRLPHLDGYGVLDQLRSTTPDTLKRILVLTASVTTRELERVRSYPVAGVIAKPFDIEVLVSAVRACVGTSLPPFRGGVISGGMIILIADLLRSIRY